MRWTAAKPKGAREGALCFTGSALDDAYIVREAIPTEAKLVC